MNEKGFTLTEIMLTVSIFVILFGYGALNFLQGTGKASLRTTTDSIIADIKQQQIKAMTGNTILGANDSYGVHFQSTNYVLFHGASYSSGNATNSTITLDSNIQFINDLLPSQNVIFTKGTGEVTGFVAGSNTIGVKNSKTGDIKTITINKYGIITNVN